MSTIIVSNALKTFDYSKSVQRDIEEYCNKNSIEYIEINSGNIWCRDYLPIMGASGNYVFFKYEPSYNTDTKIGLQQIEDAKKGREDFRQKMTHLNYRRDSNLKLDGGAIEVKGLTALVSSRVFVDNEDWSPSEIKLEIKNKLDVKDIHFIPEHPYDFTGHVDGLCRLIDENTVVKNDLFAEYSFALNKEPYYRKKLIMNWVNAFRSVMQNSGLSIQKLPYCADENKGMDATGIYMNYLKVGRHVILPKFGKQEDKKALNTLEELYDEALSFHQINSSELAEEGGILNCISWHID